MKKLIIIFIAIVTYQKTLLCSFFNTITYMVNKKGEITEVLRLPKSLQLPNRLLLHNNNKKLKALLQKENITAIVCGFTFFAKTTEIKVILTRSVFGSNTSNKSKKSKKRRPHNYKQLYGSVSSFSDDN